FGLMAKYEDLRWDGLAYSRESYQRVTDIGKADAQREVDGVREWYAKFGERLPKELVAQLDNLAERVAAMPETWRAG
ncbi:MAG TPA: phosphoenolpyruvate carboxykinase domain-containing protein, partial [Gemmatimonadales bacterium]|nr:phosphoenolpyruvate carboxykinase domain-containing protein [Gemmatimonadales bacterium]